MEYALNLWLTHPDAGNDDCMTSDSFATEAEARAAATNLETHFDMTYHRDCAFIEIDGPDCHEVIERHGVAARSRREAARDAHIDRSEMAMQAGMGLGVEAFNDALGC